MHKQFVGQCHAQFTELYWGGGGGQGMCWVTMGHGTHGFCRLFRDLAEGALLMCTHCRQLSSQSLGPAGTDDITLPLDTQ